MFPSRRHQLRRSACCFSVAMLAVAFISTTLGQTTYTWSTSTTGTSWLNSANWTGNTNHYPGVDANGSSTADGANNDIAAFGSLASGVATISINMGTSSNNGVGNNTGANSSLTLGAIDWMSTLNKATTVSNSSATAGTLTLSGVTLNGIANTILANESSQLATIQNGSGTMNLALGNSTDNVIQINGSGGITINSVIQGSGSKLTLGGSGTGTLTLSATNTYTGATTVNNGTLALNPSGTAGVINSSSALVLGGGTLNVAFNNDGTQTFNGTTLNAGASSIITSGGNGGHPASLSLGAITRNTGSTLDFTIGGNAPISTTSSNDANGLLGPGLTVGGNNWATKSGSNIVAFSAYTTQNAVGSWASNQNITNNGVFTGSLGANLTINSLRFNNNAATGPNLGSSTLTVLDGILVTSTVSSRAETISGGSLRGSSGGDLVIINNGAGTTSLTISSNIVDNTTATALTKSGANLVTLSGASNTYTGATYVNQGTLAAGVATTAFGNNSAVVVSTGATLNITGFNETIGSLASNNVSTGGTGSVVLGAATLTTGNDNTSTNFGGVISGTGNVIKTGTGTQTLSGANSYSGATTINAGTLSLDSAGSTTARLTSTSAINVNSGGTLLLANSTSTTSTDRIGNSVGVTLAGGGTIRTGGLSEGTRPTNSGATDGAAGLGALTLSSTTSGSHATIDFLTGANGSSLVFGSLSGGASAFLDIKNWTGLFGQDNSATGNDRLLFASNPGLTTAQLANFQFFDDSGNPYGSGATIISYGNLFEIVAIPEPSTYFAALLALLSVGYTQRRKLVPALKGFKVAMVNG